MDATRVRRTSRSNPPGLDMKRHRQRRIRPISRFRRASQDSGASSGRQRWACLGGMTRGHQPGLEPASDAAQALNPLGGATLDERGEERREERRGEEEERRVRRLPQKLRLRARNPWATYSGASSMSGLAEHLWPGPHSGERLTHP